MRVTLVYRGRYWVRQALELETLASVLRQGGHEVAFVYDPDVFGVSDNVLQMPRLARWFSSMEQSVCRIHSTRPDAVFLSILPGNYGWSRQVAERLTQIAPRPIIGIGLHPSLVPERIMRDAFIHAVIQGEVENIVNPLLEALRAGHGFQYVGNLWYRCEGRVVRTAAAALVDLDSLPLPDKDLFGPHVSQRASYAAMVSRGCPYHCAFCEETCAGKIHGIGYYRRKCVDTVMAELVAGKSRYHFREVIFKDSYLSGDHAWLADLMRRFRREIRVPFKCFCTVTSFDRQTARLLKEGGCYSVEFGLQTWNSRIRREVLDRAETNEQAERAFAACADERLWYDVDHMFNLPGETEHDHVEGAHRYRGLRRLNRIKVHHLVYLPTAPIVRPGMDCGALPADADERLAHGVETDFYDASSLSRSERETVAAYAALYKLLPALPNVLFSWLMRNGRVQWLRRIPSPLVALLQGLIAIRSGDLRFLVYLGFYPAKVLRAVVSRLSREGSSSLTQPRAVHSPVESSGVASA
ncbi:MAG TPA: radical SAM protein [Phycisphaerae bacterium]|nr:radical SAM protein [Phycisphaerae bacterium]